MKLPEFDFSGAQLRDAGMQLAADHAQQVSPGWNERAYSFLERFLKIKHGSFMTEDFRAWAAAHGLEYPPTNRAFGGIITKAKNNGLIKHIGWDSVKNSKAHATPASVWQRI